MDCGVQGFLPGMIIQWYGAIADIPAGWVYCDGTNGTPDLRDKFARGSSAARPPGSTGGETSHNHSFESDWETFRLAYIPDQVQGYSSGTGYSIDTNSDAVTGDTDNESTVPPYHSLAFIMKK